MNETGTVRYKWAPGQHGKGGDPSGGFVEIDTEDGTIAASSPGTGIISHIALDDLQDAIRGYDGP